MRKLSKRQQPPAKPDKNDPAAVAKYIDEMREIVKADPNVIAKYEEYEVPLSAIDDVIVQFCPLEVSAKTKNKRIYINEGFLDPDSNVKDPTEYFLHESLHLAQQISGKNLGKNNADDYLDLPSEEEAFVAQIDFKKRTESPEEAKEYTEQLLDHHDLHGKERAEKKEELLGD